MSAKQWKLSAISLLPTLHFPVIWTHQSPLFCLTQFHLKGLISQLAPIFQTFKCVELKLLLSVGATHWRKMKSLSEALVIHKLRMHWVG